MRGFQDTIFKCKYLWHLKHAVCLLPPSHSTKHISSPISAVTTGSAEHCDQAKIIKACKEVGFTVTCILWAREYTEGIMWRAACQGLLRFLSMSAVMIHCCVSQHETIFSNTLSTLHPDDEKSLHDFANKGAGFGQSWPPRNSSPPSPTLAISEIRMPMDLFHIEKFKCISIS